MHEPAINILNCEGLKIASIGEQRLLSNAVDQEIHVLFLSAVGIPELVRGCATDLSITGFDIIMETNYDVEVILNLNFGKARDD